MPLRATINPPPDQMKFLTFAEMIASPGKYASDPEQWEKFRESRGLPYASDPAYVYVVYQVGKFRVHPQPGVMVVEPDGTIRGTRYCRPDGCTVKQYYRLPDDFPISL